MEPCTTMESYFNGMRVTGDKRWTREEPKTGTGYLGTITGCKKLGNKIYYTVTWDSGPITEVEHPGPDVLIVLDSRPFGEEHNERCWWCKIFIIGFLWKCITCGDKSLCNNCYHNGKHELKHKFQRWDIQREGSSNVDCQKCKENISKVVLYCEDCNANFCNGCYFTGVDSLHEEHKVTKKSAPQAKFCKVVGTRQSGKALLKGIVEKAQVTYSAEKEANYPVTDMSDGKSELPIGKVTNICRDSRDDKFVAVIVQWPRKACKASYSLGYKGNVDLRYTKFAGMPCYPYHLPSPWELEETMQMSKQLKKSLHPGPIQPAPSVPDRPGRGALPPAPSFPAKIPIPEPTGSNREDPDDKESYQIAFVQQTYYTEDEEQLKLSPGDIILDVISADVDDEYYGTLHGENGRFPCTHVEVVTVNEEDHQRLVKADMQAEGTYLTPVPMVSAGIVDTKPGTDKPTEKPSSRCIAIRDYIAGGNDHLTFKTGTIISDVCMSGDTLWKGTMTGLFPKHVVKMNDQSKIANIPPSLLPKPGQVVNPLPRIKHLPSGRDAPGVGRNRLGSDRKLQKSISYGTQPARPFHIGEEVGFIDMTKAASLYPWVKGIQKEDVGKVENYDVKGDVLVSFGKVEGYVNPDHLQGHYLTIG